MACSTIEKEIHTCVFDSSVQPPLVGAELKGYEMDSIVQKGIIVGEDSAMLILSDSIPTSYCFDYNLNFGKRTNEVLPLRCIDCTAVNNEQYWCALFYLKGHTTYYLRAFVIDSQGNISYGETKSITTQPFNRYPGLADFANVFYWKERTLFDLMTDEIIDIRKDGFYYSTNENPNSCRFQHHFKINECYKFKREWSYLIWFYKQANQYYKYQTSVPTMYMENGRLVISAQRGEKVFYKINDKTNDPATFTDVYTEPINVPKSSRVDCYSINEKGEISYLNRYWRQ